MKNLTDKQKQVATLVIKGLNNKEVAVKLNLTTKGVKFHLTNIYKKENVKSRTQLIIKYLPIIMKYEPTFLLERNEENEFTIES